MYRPTVRGPSAAAGSRSGSASGSARPPARRARSPVGGASARVASARRRRPPIRRRRGGSSAVSGSGTASTSGVSGAASGAGSSVGVAGVPSGAGSGAGSRSGTGSTSGASAGGGTGGATRRGFGLAPRRWRSSGWVVGVELGHGDSAPSVGVAPVGGWSAVVLELERDRQIELAQAGHDALEVVPALAGDTNGVALDL